MPADCSKGGVQRNDGALGFLVKQHHGFHLEVCHHFRNAAPSIDAYSLKEQYCRTSSQSNLK